MAATDYFRRPSVSAQPSYLAPPQGSPYGQPNSAPNLSPHTSPQLGPNLSPNQFAQAPPPPPYQQPFDQRKPSVHFAPSPPLPQQRNSFSHPERPSPQMWNQPHAYSQGPPPTSVLRDSQYQPQSYYSQPQNYNSQPYFPPPPHTPPYMHPNQSDSDLGSGYSSDPEPHRRRRKHKEGRERVNSTGTSRSARTDAIIGAAGAGLIGDLLMPGLGTIGGALAGYFGGKDYGNHRKWREEKRHREQHEWELKYNNQQRSRSRSHEPPHERKRSH